MFLLHHQSSIIKRRALKDTLQEEKNGTQSKAHALMKIEESPVQ